MLPTPRILDHLFAENAGGTVEIEKTPRPGSGAVFQNEVAIEQHGLHLGKKVVIAVEVAPTRLYQANFLVGEEVYSPGEEFLGRTEICVENRYQFSGCSLQAF